MVNLDFFDHLGPFQTKNDFLLKSTSAKPYILCRHVLMGQQIDFCLKWSKSVQVGPHGSQIAKDIYVYHF